jgi:Zn-dependent peptidase ImmA (M78 family)/DNA-binding XRE family transcriptional regulator
VRWARAEDGLSEEDLASRVGVDPERVVAWEAGTEQPTKGQFSRLAQALRRPRALFFLPTPPEVPAVLANLRSAPGLIDYELSTPERRMIRRARRLQEEVSWLIRRRGAETANVLQLPTDVPASSAGQHLRNWLGVALEAQLQWGGESRAFREWRESIEERGILVFQLELGKEGIRGFSIWDDFTPALAVNTAYNTVARIFTMFHELAHLVARVDSACSKFFYSRPDATPSPQVERWCEEVASFALLPRGEFEQVVRDRFGHDRSTLVTELDQARRIAQIFKVSIRAVVIRLIGSQLAPPNLYGIVERNAKVVDRPRRGGGAGANAAERRIGQLGYSAPRLVLEATRQGEIPLRDAVDSLRLNLSQLDDLSKLVSTR